MNKFNIAKIKHQLKARKIMISEDKRRKNARKIQKISKFG